jgi:hypothetical protein
VLPDVGLLPLRDPESGAARLVDTTDPGFRRRYTFQFDQSQSLLEKRFRQAGAGWISLNVTADYTRALLRFFEHR